MQVDWQACFSNQEQRVLANVFGAELVRRLVEVLGELGDRGQIQPNRGGRIVADLEIFQHSLSE